jgi:hypothetical protein
MTRLNEADASVRLGERCVSRFEAGGAVSAMRIAVVVYVVQAVLGIAAGFAYAMWLMYPV